MSYFVDRIKPPHNRKLSEVSGEVAVVGSGISGLVEAYFLAKQGIKVTVFDASSRSGGKIRTSGNQVSGRRFEYGAEFVASEDNTLLQLCNELNVPLTASESADATSKTEAGEMLYHVDNKIYTEKDVLEWFAPIAPTLQILKDALRDKKGNWTKEAVQLDNMSLEQFFDQLRQSGVDERLLTIFKQSYTGEIGNHVSRISALNFVDCVSTDITSYEPYGVCDEAYKLTNGTQSLTDALRAKCEEMGVQFKYGEPVKNLTREGDKVTVHTDLGNTQSFDHVALATSLPMLKHIGGLENVGIPAEQIALLNSMQHTNGIKIGLAVKGDAWKHCPIPSDGSFVSDTAFQQSWAISSEAAQLSSPAAPSPHGMVIMLIGDVQNDTDIPALIEQCKKEYAKMLGKPVDDIFENTIAPEFTVSRGEKNGCWVSPGVGQYVSLCTAGKQQPDAPVSIVGSHHAVATSIGTKLGFMECGASSAHENALAVAQKLRNQNRSAAPLAQQFAPEIDPVQSAQQLRDKINGIILGGGNSRA